MAGDSAHEGSRVTVSYRGLCADAIGLHFAPRALFFHRRPTLRFTSSGVVVVEQDGPQQLLDWEKYNQSWKLEFVSSSRNRSAGVQVATFTSANTWPKYRWIPSRWGDIDANTFSALVEYLVQTPSARSGLDDSTRVRRLVLELAAKRWLRPGPPSEPLMGVKLDVFVAVSRALVAAGWRTVRRRPIIGELSPNPAEIAARARLLMSKQSSAAVSDFALEAAAVRHLSTAPWPFGVLCMQ